MPLLAGTITPASGTVPAGSSQTLTLTATAPAANGLSGGTAVVNLGGTAFTDNYSYLGLPGLSPSAVGPDGQPQPRAACTPSTLYVLPTSPQQNSVDTVGSPIAIEVLVADNCGNPLTSGNVTATFSSGDPRSVYDRCEWPGTVDRHLGSDRHDRCVGGDRDQYNGDDGWHHRNRQTAGGAQPHSHRSVVPPADAVVSSADSSTPDSGAPGSILSIFGENLASGTASLTGLPLPTTLLDTSVTLGTTPLYLYFVSPTQINAFVPYNFMPGTTPQLVVSRSGNNTTSVPLT